jgi:hypothetical protein
MRVRGRSRGRWALAVAALGAAGCEDVPITKPGPSLSGIDHVAIGLAVVLAGLVTTTLLVHLLLRRRRTHRWRVAAAAVFGAVAVSGLAMTIWLLAVQVRMNQILDGGTCRVMPEEELPAQIVQLSCDTSYDAGSAVLIAAILVIVLPVVAIALLCAADVLHRPRPWWPAICATAGAVGLAVGDISSVADGAGARQVVIVGMAAALMGATAAACWYELSTSKIAD